LAQRGEFRLHRLRANLLREVLFGASSRDWNVFDPVVNRSFGQLQPFHDFVQRHLALSAQFDRSLS
jgi:hypothetical protein